MLLSLGLLYPALPLDLAKTRLRALSKSGIIAKGRGRYSVIHQLGNTYLV